MLTVAQAWQAISEHIQPRAATTCSLDASLGRILAEDIHSDIDSPPFDKSMVDGFAIRCADLKPDARLEILECVLAGQTPRQIVRPGTATQIMTGAPVPEGADAVVMVEDCETDTDSSFVTIGGNTRQPGAHIMRRATALAKDAVVIQAGNKVRPVELGVMAEVGCVNVPVYCQPTVGVISTGDELVDASEMPTAGLIRNSNGPLLSALVMQSGAIAHGLGIVRDDQQALQEIIHTGLENDVLLLSGGVSAGTKDYVPAMLQQCNVEEIFHKVQLKPGKPLWFGVTHRSNHTCLVFGLPGNPVSSLVCYLLFVAPALAAIQGQPQPPTDEIQGILTTRFTLRGDRPTYYPARSQWENGKLAVTPLAWKGSADQKTLAAANCLAFFHPPQQVYDVGESITLFPFPW